jgi:hypothetical protein
MTIPIDAGFSLHGARALYWDSSAPRLFRNLRTHIERRSIIWYQRWVDEHG